MRTLIVICALFLSLTPISVATMFRQSAADNGAAITPVAGESWLEHIRRPLSETSMGRASWRLGPSAAADRAVAVPSPKSFASTQIVTLHGSDLYRLNCQGCHGESGRGAPPEIASLIDPVRSTSATLVAERMKKVGMTSSRQQTAEFANQSRSALLKRLHDGGQDMPSFPHLSGIEIRSLVAYLKQLAGVPGAESEQVAIQEPPARVGELIVKSTCHVCHDATGLNPTPAELVQGKIPPLSMLPVRVNQAQLVRKVTGGAPAAMGTTLSDYRSRMPVFNYLSANEAADVYEYLASYPPTELANLDQVSQEPRSDSPAAQIDLTEVRVDVPPLTSQLTSAQVFAPLGPFSLAAFPIGAGLFTVALLASGCWITIREFRRLSPTNHAREAALEPPSWAASEPAIETVAEILMDPSGVATEPLARESVERESSSWMEERKIS